MRYYQKVRKNLFQNRREKIGICGVSHGMGVTSLVLSFAAAFVGRKKENCLCIFMDRDSVQMNFLEAYDVVKFCGNLVLYQKDKIDYVFCSGLEEIKEAAKLAYDVLLYDLGVLPEKMLLEATDVESLFIIGSLRPWCYHNYQFFFSNCYQKNQDMLQGKCYALGLNMQEKMRFEKEFGKCIKELPYINNPWKLTRLEAEALLQMC